MHAETETTTDQISSLLEMPIGQMLRRQDVWTLHLQSFFRQEYAESTSILHNLWSDESYLPESTCANPMECILGLGSSTD